VIAFEANPALVERVEQNIALNGFAHVNVVSAAVSNQAGELAFYVSSSPGKSSTHEIDHAAQKLIVPAITLDGYLAEHPLDRLDVIKMDIEGSDCAALIGASGTLTRFRPLIVFEYKPITPLAQEAFSLLARLDYELWSLARSGERRRFDPHTTTDTDVLCIPPAR
jgi:FkbM family methyltransferase